MLERITEDVELIKALRRCGDENNEWCVDETYKCPLWNEDRITDDCKAELMTAAADALEAADRLLDQNTQRCEALRKQLRESHESYERHIAEQQEQIAKLYILLNNRINEIAELEAQLQKEVECDAANVNGNQSDEDKAVMDCSYCPSADGCLEAFSESTLCPRVTGEQMRGEHDE